MSSVIRQPDGPASDAPTLPEHNNVVVSEAGVTPQKKWVAGTLTYTSAGVATLFVWLLPGDFAWSMRDRSVAPMAQWYLTTLAIPNLAFGLLISTLPAVIGVLLGPYISVKSDRHRGRLGRRIPFLLVTAPISALGMIGLGVTPFLVDAVNAGAAVDAPFGQFLQTQIGSSAWGSAVIAGMQSRTIVGVVFFAIFWTLFEIATNASQAVFGGLINDVVPTPLIGRFFGLFRAVSLIDGIIFNFWIMGLVPAHYTLIFVSIGVVYAAAFAWVCMKVKEGAYPPPPIASDVAKNVIANKFAGATRYFRESFSNPYYIWVFLMISAAGLVFLPVNTFAIPYAKSLGIDMDVYGKFLALTFVISLCLSFFLGWLADLFHPLRVAIVTLALYAGVTAWGAVYATTPNGFLIVWVMHGVLSGSYMTGAASMAQRLFPRSKYAQFASAAGLVGAFAHASVGGRHEYDDDDELRHGVGR